jgi:hypothetical protein
MANLSWEGAKKKTEIRRIARTLSNFFPVRNPCAAGFFPLR